MPDRTAAATGKNYAIMRVERIRDLGEMRRIEQHNTREKVSENIEPVGPAPRELLPDAHADTVDGARERMAELQLDLRQLKGSVGVEVILTTSKAWWDTATDQMQQDWIAANRAWLGDKFGRALLSAKLHEDEKTPHIHAVALSAVSKVDSVRGPKPKTDEGWARRRAEEEKRKARWRWNYRDLFGQDFEHLSREQDRYHAAVAHLGLDRGERRREVTDVVLDNGVVAPAAQVSRGKRLDGSDRPRRTVTTQQYQAAARDDRARAADERRQAETERQAAAVAMRRADEERETAARAARRADDDRRAAAVERTEMRKLRLEQDAAIARQQHELDSLRAAATADRDAAERHRRDLDDAREVMIASRDRSAADAAVADRKRRDAEAAEAAAIAERETIAATRRALDERPRIEVAQLALLAHAADDRAGLDLRLVGDSFAIGPNGLTEEDHAAKAKGWSRPLMAMARSLAQAPRLPELSADLNEELVNRAIAFLRRTSLPIEPRKQWPAGGMPRYDVGGNIAEALRAQPGKALCVWGDAGWGGLVRRGKYMDGRFSDDLVAAMAAMIQAWSPQPAPTWVTAAPSLRHPELVPDFASRLALALGLPFHMVLEKNDERPEQKTMANSTQQARNVDGSLVLSGVAIPAGPVLLIDDMVDSRWTLTVAAWLLRLHGAGDVYPVALAQTGQGD